MKKLLAILMTLAMLFSFVGCGNKDGDNGNNGKGASSPEKAVETYVTKMYEGSIDDYISVLSQQAKNAFCGNEDGENATDSDVKSALKERREATDVEVKNVEILDVEHVDDDDTLIEIQAEYDEVCGDNGDKITDAAIVEVEIEVDYEGELDSSETDFNCVEIDGKWYIFLG